MDKKEILEKLQNIIRSAVDDEEVIINDSTVASDVDGWDSLAQILIVGELQNELGVKFTSTEISKFSNVGELVDAVIEKL